jgi:CRISPR-associated protein (TIGR03984 family)
MKHKIVDGLHSIQSINISETFTSNPPLVLSEQARSYGLRWFLAHADDGVIWGEFRPDGLHTSSDAFPDISPPLRAETLQQMRLFGPLAELLVWREGSHCQARLIRDDAGELQEFLDEAHLLWGNTAEQKKDGFVLLREG